MFSVHHTLLALPLPIGAASILSLFERQDIGQTDFGFLHLKARQLRVLRAADQEVDERIRLMLFCVSTPQETILIQSLLEVPSSTTVFIVSLRFHVQIDRLDIGLQSVEFCQL